MKTGQQSKVGCDDNLGLDVPNNNETNSGDGNDNVLDENRKNEGGKDVCNDANFVGKSCDGDNGDGDNSDGIVIMVVMTAMMLVTHLPVVTLLVKEKRK